MSGIQTLAFFAAAIVFASYRLGWMFAKERGPFDFCRQMRRAIERSFPTIKEDGNEYTHWFVEGSTCPVCVSWNVNVVLSIISAVVLLIGWQWLVALWAFGVGVVALSGVTLFIQRRS